MGTYDHAIDHFSSGETMAASAAPRARIVQTILARAPELLTLFLYGALLTVMVPRHEGWTDEAQAWQLARSLPYLKMMFGYLGYEGAPGLWHSLLWIIARAGFGYAGMHWISAGIAFAGVAVFLFTAPFPRYVKLGFPFTYYIAYQYAIIARSYVLFPLILFLTLALWNRKARRPALFALLLGLMANVSLHTAMISGGLALISFFELRRDGVQFSDLKQLRWLAAIGILLGLYALAIVTAKPPADNASLAINPWGAIFSLARPLAVACGPSLSSSMVFNLFFWIVFFITFLVFDEYIYLAPAALFFLFSCVVFARLWHYGILYLSLVAIFWITWDRLLSLSRITIYALFLIASFDQVAWTVTAYRHDYGNAYSPDAAAAAFLEPSVASGARIAPLSRLPSYSVGLQPYFDRNIYFDQRFTFWWWSRQNTTATDVTRVIAERPDIVVVAAEPYSPGAMSPACASPYTDALKSAGYLCLRTFCGAKDDGFRISTPMCHLVFARQGAASMNPVGPEARQKATPSANGAEKQGRK